MKPKKAKLTVPSILITSEEGLESSFNLYVATRLDLIKAKAKMEAKIASLKAEFDREHALDQLSVVSLETGIALYCQAHRSVLFPAGQKKSRNYANGDIGYRDNPASVGKIVEKDTFDRIAERMAELEWAEPFVEWSVGLKKNELLARRAEITDEQLAQAGIKFEKGETFYIEPSSDLLDAAKKIQEKEAA